MEIKNFTRKIFQIRPKTLAAIFACLAVFLAIVAFDGKEQKVSAGISSIDCVVAGSVWNPNGLDYACAEDRNWSRVSWGGAKWSTNLKSDDKCHCLDDYNRTEGAYEYNHYDANGNIIYAKGSSVGGSSDAPAAGGVCSGGDAKWGAVSENCGENQYCFGGVCDYGCPIAENDDDDNSANDKFVKLGDTTCKKPSYLSADGVYQCTHKTGQSVDLRKGDGNSGGSGPTSSYYGLDLVEVCYSGCSNGACVNKNTCLDMAGSIENAFGVYNDGVRSIAANGSCAGVVEIESRSDADTCYNNLKTKVKNTLMNISNKDSIITVFEMMVGSKSVNGYKLFTAKSGTMPKVSSLTQQDILCAYNSDLSKFAGVETICGGNSGKLRINNLENRKCAAQNSSKMSSPFQGYSYGCEKLGSCYVYSWLLNSGVKECSSTEKDIFTQSVYFKYDKNGYPFDGWGMGSESGCEYVSYASLALGDSENSKNKNLNYYYENKTFTGFCSNSSGASIDASALGTCTAYVGEPETTPETEEAAIISYEIDQTGGGQIEHTVVATGVDSCVIPKDYFQKVNTSVKNTVQKALQFVGANQQTGEKTFKLPEDVSNLFDSGEDSIQIGCTVVCGDQQQESNTVQESDTVTVYRMEISNEQPNKCLHNNVWYSAGQSICDGNNSKTCTKDQKQSGDISYAGWVDKGCESGCDPSTGKCACWSSSEGRYYAFGEYKCGNCAYEGSSAIQSGSCFCDKGAGWVLKEECSLSECDGHIGRCEAGVICSASNPQSCSSATGEQDCAVCGAGWVCQKKTTDVAVSFLGFNANVSIGGDYICVPGGGEKEGGECKLSSKINVGTPNFRYTGCDGAYVKFTLNNSGDCSKGITCEVFDDYNGGTTPADLQSNILPATTTSNWSACVPIQSRYDGSQGGSSANIPDKINFSVKCYSNDGESESAGAKTCDNLFKEEDKQKQEEEQKSKEGGACENDDDCQSGLVCVEGECVTEEDARKKEKENNTAPQVNISSPTGTIEAKTTELRVSTDIAANCKYMLGRDGSFNDFNSGGMTMGGSGGTSHTATLSNLTNDSAQNCKYDHTVTVMCKNSKASADAAGAVGSAQTSFSVDLSKNEEFAPVVSSNTDDEFSIPNPVLKAITDRPADCRYKEGGSFNFQSGKPFETTGDYNHNTQLDNLENDDYTYYVVCRDKETCAVNSSGTEIEFTVDLSQNPEYAPVIVSTTPEIQTIANPVLSITTDRPAICQYKQDYTFAYDGGTQFANDGEYAHSAPLADLDDGEYTFYVACKDKATDAAKTLETAIVTTLDRDGDANAPVISNTTPASQNTSSPALSVITNIPAICQYKEGADFEYGQGTQFTIDGGTGHSAIFANVPDGTYTYYVVCQDPATGAANSPGAQIMFTVSAASEICADLSSNDKQNDKDRDYDYDDADSEYLWRSVETGTREKFTEVDWHAGYQFSVEEDGYATSLCGYFEYGQTNRVSLYGGSYDELAYAEVDGEDGWNCVAISPARLKADRRYYVIARVQNAPIYFEYRSGLLPRGGDNATVESGIRQLADEEFGNGIKKYDYMIFGLVDVMIKSGEESTIGPEIVSVSPDDQTTESDTKISLETDVDSVCKFDREDTAYADMKYTFGKTGQTQHEQKICDLDDGMFTWFARCKGEGGTNNASTMIRFEVED